MMSCSTTSWYIELRSTILQGQMTCNFTSLSMSSQSSLVWKFFFIEFVLNVMSSSNNDSYSCSSKEAATDLLAYVKTPHPWLLSGDEEYDRSHRDVSFK